MNRVNEPPHIHLRGHLPGAQLKGRLLAWLFVADYLGAWLTGARLGRLAGAAVWHQSHRWPPGRTPSPAVTAAAGSSYAQV